MKNKWIMLNVSAAILLTITYISISGDTPDATAGQPEKTAINSVAKEKKVDTQTTQTGQVIGTGKTILAQQDVTGKSAQAAQQIGQAITTVQPATIRELVYDSGALSIDNKAIGSVQDIVGAMSGYVEEQIKDKSGKYTFLVYSSGSTISQISVKGHEERNLTVNTQSGMELRSDKQMQFVISEKYVYIMNLDLKGLISPERAVIGFADKYIESGDMSKLKIINGVQPVLMNTTYGGRNLSDLINSNTYVKAVELGLTAENKLVLLSLTIQ